MEKIWSHNKQFRKNQDLLRMTVLKYQTKNVELRNLRKFYDINDKKEQLYKSSNLRFIHSTKKYEDQY